MRNQRGHYAGVAGVERFLVWEFLFHLSLFLILTIFQQICNRGNGAV